MTDTIKPKLLAMGMAKQALGDPKFKQLLPEFRTLDPKVAAMQTQRTGCGGCRKRAVANNLFRDFLHVVMALDTNGRERLRSYFGGPLMVSLLDPKTKRYETITI